MKIEINKYGDVWFDNGLTNFYSILKRIGRNDSGNLFDELNLTPFGLAYSVKDDKMKEFLQRLSKYISESLRPAIIVKGKDKKGIEKEFKKDFVLIQRKKINGVVILKEKIFQNGQTEKELKEIYSNLTEGKNRCFLCGRSFKKPIKKLQQASYPFVTKIKSLSGIRSGPGTKLKEYESAYCPQCYLIGILEWLDGSIIYNVVYDKSKSVLILPYSDDLNKLYELKRILDRLLNNTSRTCNIRREQGKDDVIHPEGKFATFVSFYEMFLLNIPDLFGAYDLSNWYIMESGLKNVKNPKLHKLNVQPPVVSLIKNLLKDCEVRFYRDFVMMFYAFKKKKDSNNIRNLEKELKEKLCESFVNDDFEKFASCFVPSRGTNIGLKKEAYQSLEKILLKWRLKGMSNIEKEDLFETLKKAGENLSKLIKNRMSLFFKFEKAKSKSEILKILEEIIRRLAVDKGNFETNYGEWKKLKPQDKKKIEYVNKASIEKAIDLIIKKGDDRKFLEDVKNILLIYMSLNIKTKNNEED